MTVSACLWLGLFPLLHFGSFHTITQDKWVLMWVLSGVTLACFLADGLSRRLSFPGRLPLLLGAGLLCWMVISCLLSPYPASVWWIGSGRREGLAAQLCYLGLFFLFSFSKIRSRPVLLSAAAGLAVFLAVVLRQRGGGNPFGLYPEDYSYENASYFQGTIGNVDMCSGYLILLCGLFLPALAETVRQFFRPRDQESEPRRNTILMACILAAALAADMFLLITINVQAGLLALIVLLIWTPLRFLPKKARPACLLLLLAALLLFVWLGPVSSGPAWELHEILHGRAQPSFGSGRVGIWIWTVRMLRSEGRLSEGTGADTFALRFSRYLQSWYANHPETERMEDYVDTPHCEYLAWAVNFGIPGLLLFLAVMIAGCFGAPAWRGGVLGYAVQAALSFSVCLVAPMFWAVLGLSQSAYAKKEDR